MVYPVNRASSIFTASLDDANEHDFPNVDGEGAETGTADHNRAAWDARGARGVQASVTNGQDQTISSAELQGAGFDDPNFEDPETVDEATNLGQGEVERLQDTEAGYSYYRVVVQYADAPTSGETTVRFANHKHDN